MAPGREGARDCERVNDPPLGVGADRRQPLLGAGDVDLDRFARLEAVEPRGDDAALLDRRRGQGHRRVGAHSQRQHHQCHGQEQHSDHRGVVYIGIVRVVVLERPAARAQAGATHGPVADDVGDLQRSQPLTGSVG